MREWKRRKEQRKKKENKLHFFPLFSLLSLTFSKSEKNAFLKANSIRIYFLRNYFWLSLLKVNF